jgi:hypothetical protein
MPKRVNFAGYSSQKGAPLEVSNADDPGRTRRRTALLFVAICAAGATLAAIATAASSQRVTLTVQRYFDPACTPLPGYAPTAARGGCEKLRFSGTISSGAANEYVSVLFQSCGSKGLGTSLAGAPTRAGGAWEAEWWTTAGTFRARWGASVSEPVRFRDSVPLQLTKLSPFRHRVGVTGSKNMKGRVVELQRLVSGQWRLLRRARLVADRSSYGVNSSATFAVRRRGLILRAFVPAKSALPCYVATASETWTSGVGSGTASGTSVRVIDRTLLCTTAVQGGIPIVSIRASSGTGSGAVQSGPSFSASTGFARDSGFASAGSSSLSLNRSRCTEARARVALSAKKLKGGPALSWQEYECDAPPRVLVRLRAVFRAPTTLESNRETGYERLFANGDVKEASLAIRTQAGRPLGFATLNESGQARLFAAASCIEDS